MSYLCILTEILRRHTVTRRVAANFCSTHAIVGIAYTLYTLLHETDELLMHIRQSGTVDGPERLLA